MDGTPRLPRGPAPLASMCRHRCWKTFLHASQIGIQPDSIRRNFPCGRALAFRLCTVQCVVWMPGRGRFGGKRWTAAQLRLITSYSYGPPFPRLRCNRQPNFAGEFLYCSVIVRYVLTAFRNQSAAALRNLRDRHGQHRKAAPNRIAPARLRLQVRRLQPDHIGRAGAAGRGDPSPGGINAAAAGASQDGSHPKTLIPHAGTAFFLTMPHVKLRSNFS
jgi:hypothetical protein